MKKRILFISAHLPSMTVPQAGHKIAYDLVKDYSKEHAVDLVAFYNPLEMPYLGRDDLSFCDRVFYFKVTRLTRLAAILTHPFLPMNACVRLNGAARRLIRKLQKENQYGSVHFEFTAVLTYLNDTGNIPVKIANEHDIVYQAVERKRERSKGLLKTFYRFEYPRQKKWELNKLSQCQQVMTNNPKDKDLLVRDGVAPDKIRVIKPRMDSRFEHVNRGHADPNVLLFWGAMSRPENIDAVEWFVQDMFPELKRSIPELKFYIVGANPPARILALNSPDIVVTGFVEDPVPYFEKCAMAVVPLRLGAGVKIKVLEYLTAGVPVITTSVGAEGIDNKSLVIAETAKEFVEKITERLVKK